MPPGAVGQARVGLSFPAGVESPTHMGRAVLTNDLGPEANIMGSRVAWQIAQAYRGRPG